MPLTCAFKDFTTVLSMNSDSRSGLLSQLREIFDGHLTKEVGTSDVRVIDWSGHFGFLAGVTTAIDAHHEVKS